MVIAVNTRFLRNDYLEGYGNFLYECFYRITTSHPEHQFIFIFDRDYDNRFIFNKNVKAVVVRPQARHPLLWKYWYDIKIPAVLKKNKADVFVSCDGFCSLTTKVPQCIVVHDLSFLHYPLVISKSHLLYYKRYTPFFLKKARKIVTVSQYSKKDIIAQYGIDETKIDVVPNAARNVFTPLDDETKKTIKADLTEGKEYFIYAGSIHPRKNLVNLLKAFSVFKKKQLSNWKLVLTGRLAWKNRDFLESLKTYKYRTDVVLTGYVSERQLASVIGSAYAMVYPSLWEGFGIPVLEAMACDVPVITSANSAMQTIAGEAALYADPGDHNDLAAQMMTLYKDENLRRRLIKKGKEVEASYDWDTSAKLLWESIIKTTGPVTGV